VFFKEFAFVVDPAKITITHQGDLKILEEGQNLEKVKQAIATDLAQVVNRIREDATAGNVNYLKKLPIINIFPLIALYHTTNTAEKVSFAADHIEYDFSPKSFKVVSS
jgi:hypothetical protein